MHIDSVGWRASSFAQSAHGLRSLHIGLTGRLGLPLLAAATLLSCSFATRCALALRPDVVGLNGWDYLQAFALGFYFDVVADNFVNAGDALAVINNLNALGPTSLSVLAAGEASVAPGSDPLDPAAVDECLALSLDSAGLTPRGKTARRL